MMVSKSNSIRVFLCRMILIGVFVFSACQQTDYYSSIMQDGTCVWGNNELSKDCIASIEKHAPINLPSFQNQPELQQEIIKAIHLLLTAPMAFPVHKKMFGLGTLREAQMYDFLEKFGGKQGPAANQAIVNYILNAAKEIRYGCIKTNTIETDRIVIAYYDSNAIFICEQFFLGMSDMFIILFHESRHSEVDHVVRFNRDASLDEAYGWHFGLIWGLIQGTNIAKTPYFQRDTIISLVKNNILMHDIYSLPPQFSIFKNRELFLEQYLDNLSIIESLQNISLDESS